MTDRREMLELAALAAGIDGELTWTPGASPWLRVSQELARPWSPITNDGDALRLAVSLGLVVDCSRQSAGEPFRLRHAQEDCKDLHAATRLAITRAAAEIGKQLSAHKGGA